VLALVGSLRTASTNAAFCRAASRLAGPGLGVSVFAGLASLPPFNPDLEDALPDPVRALREEVSRADALLIASPEYAHGISGVMKNALDWLVSSEDMANKPVAVVNTSPHARHGFRSLIETLRTMSTEIIAEACIRVAIWGACTTEDDLLASPDSRASIRRVLVAIERCLLAARSADRTLH
jgi:chromate reductase, NAD(P)H dehydrogenase (quinone)